MQRFLISLLVAVLGAVVIGAQGAPPPALEVASVKRNVSGRTGGSFRVPPAGTITFTNMTLRVVIRQAYQVDPGLKLEPREAPVEVLVVDSVAMPVPD
ncbi:MAG TPA: hypothetical protein VL173_10505 [Vicinamibacterales bacterium]|nr:hypothetical protein [Vicinamibacterales bacterium]